MSWVPDPTPAGNPVLTVASPHAGELGIKERRSWQTWQLLVAALVAALLGMAIGHSGSSSGAGATTANTAYHVTPPQSSPVTAPPGDATGTNAPGPTASSVAPTTAAPPVSGTGTLKRLVPKTQSKGSGTTNQFTVTGGQWNIGWAFNCAAAPGGAAPFQIFVVPAAGTPGATPAVDQNSAKGQGVTPQSSLGAQSLNIKSDPGCIWVVNVVGMGS